MSGRITPFILRTKEACRLAENVVYLLLQQLVETHAEGATDEKTATQARTRA